MNPADTEFFNKQDKIVQKTPNRKPAIEVGGYSDATLRSTYRRLKALGKGEKLPGVGAMMAAVMEEMRKRGLKP